MAPIVPVPRSVRSSSRSDVSPNGVTRPGERRFPDEWSHPSEGATGPTGASPGETQCARGDGDGGDLGLRAGRGGRHAGPGPRGPITAARPAGLVVPAAGIDAGGVGTLGLDETGELQAPATPNAVGWYRDGATPGDPGTAVLVGHVDSYRGPGVFSHLRNLRPGDTIDVPRSDGTVAHFGVDAVETVDKDAFPAERVYAPPAGPSVRLITCGGPFDRSARSYEDNVVVFASPR